MFELGVDVASFVGWMTSVPASDVERVGVERVTSESASSVELVGVEVKPEEVGAKTRVSVSSEVRDSGNVCLAGLDADVGYRTDKFLGAGASKVSLVVLEQLAEPSGSVEQQRHNSAW